METTLYPRARQVSSSPAQCQQVNPQYLQNFHELHNKHEPQYPKAAFPLQTSHHQIGRYVPVQHSNNRGIFAHNSEHQRKPSKQGFSQHLQERSNLNNKSGLKARKHFNNSLSVSTSSAAPKGNSAQTFTSWDQLSVVKNNPCLYSLLTDSPDLESFYGYASSSQPEKTRSSIEFGVNEKHWRQMKIPPASLNCERRARNQNHAEETHSAASQQLISPSSLSGQRSTGYPPTDEDIMEFIKARLKQCLSIHIKQKNSESSLCNKGNSPPWAACTRPESDIDASVFTTCASNKDGVWKQTTSAVPEQCTVAAGQALEEDSSKCSSANPELIPKFKEKGDRSASEKRSTGILIAGVEKSKHASKNESFQKGASDLNLPMQKPLHLTLFTNDDGKLVCSYDCEDKTSVSGNAENFHSKCCDKSSLNRIPTLYYSLSALNALIACLENVETIAEMDNFFKVILQQYWNDDIDNVRLFASTDYPKIMREVTATCARTEENEGIVCTMPGMTWIDLSEKNPRLGLRYSSEQEEKSVWSNTDQNLSGASGTPKNQKEGRDNVLKTVVRRDKVHGVMDVSKDSKTPGLGGNQAVTIREQKNIKKQCHVTSKEAVAHSSLDSSVTKIQTAGSVTGCLPCFAVSDRTSSKNDKEDAAFLHSCAELYENRLKEPSPQCGSVVPQTITVPLLKDPKYDDISDVEDQAQVNTTLPSIEHEKLSFSNPPYEETNHSYSPSSLFKDEDELDDDWLVIPLTVSNVTIEPVLPNDGGTSPALSEVQQPVPNPAPASGFSEMEIFDTPYQQAESVRFVKLYEMAPGGSILESRRDSYSESEDSGETEDSCDYPSDEEHNSLTNRLLVKRLPCPLSETDGSDSEKGNENDKETHFKKNKNRSRPKTAKKFHKLFRDSDTKHKSKRNSTKMTKRRKRLHSSGSHHSEAAPSQRKRRSSETVDSQCGTVEENVIPSVDSPQHLSHRTEMCEQTPEDTTKPEHIEHEITRQKSVNDQSVIILDSESEDDGNQNCNQTYPVGSGNVPYVIQNSEAEPEDSEPTCSSVDSSNPQDQSGLPELKRDECSGQSHSLQSEQLTKAKVCSEHVQQNRPKTFKAVLDESDRVVKKGHIKKKAKMKRRIVSSESEDSGDALPGKQKPQKISLSSGDSPEPQHFLSRTETCGQLPENTTRSEHVHHEITRPKISSGQGVIILDSDSEDDSDQTYKQMNRNTPMEPEDSKYETAKENLREAACSSRNSSKTQQQSGLHDTKLKKDARSGLSGRLTKAKVIPEHAQQNRPKISEVVHDESDRVRKKDHIKKTAKRRRRIVSSESEDSDDASPVAQTSLGVKQKLKKVSLPSEVTPEENPLSVGREAHSPEGPNPVIPRLFIRKSSQAGERLKLVKQSNVHSRRADETRGTVTTPSATSQKPDSCKEKTQHLRKEKQSSASSHHATAQPTPVQRQHSSSSKLRRSHSHCCNPSTSGHQWAPKNPFSTSKLSSARQHVISDWQTSCLPIRGERRASQGMEEESRPKNDQDSLREARPGPSHGDRPPRRRRHSQGSIPHLMKKTLKVMKFEGIQRKNARTQEAAREQRHPVGKHFKWKNSVERDEERESPPYFQD